LNLSPGWDGYDGQAPSAGAVFEAQAFLKALPSSVRLAKPMIAGDGEVGLYWDEPGLYLEIGFRGDGRLSWYGEKDGQTYTGESESINSPDVMERISALIA